jgi:hypothetical protein
MSCVYAGVSRRGLLQSIVAAATLAGVGAAAGCDLFGRHSGPGTADVPTQVSDLLASTVALGDAYDNAIAQAPSLSSLLTGPRDAHRAHARALAEALGKPVPASSTAGPGRSGDPTALRAGLVDAETKGQDAARTACLAAPGRLAPLIGSIAAARACHLEILK